MSNHCDPSTLEEAMREIRYLRGIIALRDTEDRKREIIYMISEPYENWTFVDKAEYDKFDTEYRFACYELEGV